jgi:hypothetical protein
MHVHSLRTGHLSCFAILDSRVPAHSEPLARQLLETCGGMAKHSSAVVQAQSRDQPDVLHMQEAKFSYCCGRL